MVQHPGMSLRVWLAGQGNVSWGVAKHLVNQMIKETGERGGEGTVAEIVDAHAMLNLRWADAFLMEYEKSGKDSTE